MLPITRRLHATQSPNILLPFLNRTPAIQAQSTIPQRRHRVKSAWYRDRQAQYAARKEQRQQPKKNDIPFERPSHKKDSYAELELAGSTITPGERKAFEELFDLSRNEGNGVIRKVLSGDGVKGLDADGRRKEGMPEVLRSLLAEREKRRAENDAEEVDEVGGTAEENSSPSSTDAVTMIATGLNTANKDLYHYKQLLARCSNDSEIWDILVSRIFRAIQDSSTPASVSYVHHLVTTCSHLLKHYPTSVLPLSILSTLRFIGPAGLRHASVTLYNLHLSTLFTRYGSPGFAEMIFTISEMAKLEHCTPDSKTLEILDDILYHARRARQGDEGGSEKILFEMAGTSSRVDEIEKWRVFVLEKVTEKALKAVSERDSTIQLEV